jgi:hypothetical protein
MARDCIKRIVEKSGGKITKEDAKLLIDEVDAEAKRRVSGGFDFDDAVRDIVAERLDNATFNLMKQKANMARNMVIKKRGLDKISTFIDKGLSIKDAFIADLEGVSSHIEGTRDSLDIQKSAVEHAYFSRFIGQLNKEGLLPILNSKALDDEIGKELWALSNKKKGATENKQAARIAEIIFDTREQQRTRLNKAGADISEVGGYVMPQRHDTAEMIKVGEDKWVADIMPLVDKTRTFDGEYSDLETSMRKAYRAMVTGIRLNDPLVKDAKLFQFTGPANLGKKLSSARQIHFKDYDSWKTWNKTYGSKDINEGVIDSIRFDSNNIAMMERYGTNPEAMLDALANEAKAKYRDKAAKEGELGIDNKLKQVIDAAMEKNMIAAHPQLARIGSNIRVYNNVTTLGGAVISSITDIPMKALEYQFQGKSWLSSTVQPFMDLTQGFKSKQDRVKFASLSGVGWESMISDIGGRFSAQDNMSNKAAKVQRTFFKLNGLAWWTDTHKNAMGRVMSHHLGLEKQTTFADLDADTKRLFGNYNITEKDWDMMRKSAVQLEDGREYILPEYIDNNKVREKLIGYYVDRTNFGVITPGAREQRIMSLGTQRGTAVGEATRLLMQFKSFPTSVITKVWGRALYGKGKADVPAMAYLMLMSMGFGYMASAAKDIIKNKTPKDPMKLETAFAALAQGGGIGIMGDILLQDGSGFGRSITQSMAGPTAGKIDNIFKIYSAGIRGGGSARQALNTGVSLVPFNNLFYTRAALDQILLLQMQESLNPGYLRRMENNMRKTYGQQLLFK